MANENKQNTLEHLNQIYWHQFGYHREKEYRIFVLSSAILIAGMTGLMTGGGNDKVLLDQYGVVGKILSFVTICVWIGISVWMQTRERMHGDKYSGVIVRISKNLHCFKNGYFNRNEDSTLLPKEWQEWESEETPNIYRLIFKNFIPITFLLGVIVLLALWAY